MGIAPSHRNGILARMEIALATCAAMPGLAGDDRRLLAALRRRGLAAGALVWEDALADWPRAGVTVIRSCWDYAWRLESFLAWLDGLDAARVWNPPDVIRWNAHKRYLTDLSGRGVPAVPTEVLAAGSRVDLRKRLVEREWPDAVLKAAVGNSGRYARRVLLRDVEAGQDHLDRVLAVEDMLLQPLVPSISSAGELSLVFVDGVFSHAVRKRAAPGDFRVHDDYGGSVRPEDPRPSALAAAERAMGAVEAGPALYGRVDLVDGPDGEPLVMELELIEPELYLRFSPDGTERLAGAIAGRLSA